MANPQARAVFVQLHATADLVCLWQDADVIEELMMPQRRRRRRRGYQGWACFDDSLRYVGPLPFQGPHGRHAFKLKGRGSDGLFKTSHTASYPPAMCSWLAELIVRSFFDCSLKAGKATSLHPMAPPRDVESMDPSSDEDEDGEKA